MTEGLREFDTTVGRCNFCGEMVLLEELAIDIHHECVHQKCLDEWNYKSSLI